MSEDIDEELDKNANRGDDFEGIEDEDLEDEDLDEEGLEDEDDEDLDEEDDDDDEDPEDEEDEDPDDDEDEGKNKPSSIPKERLDAVIAQREAEKDRVAWLEEQLETLISSKTEPTPTKEPKESSFDFIDAEEKYANFLIEGETAQAIQLRNTIDEERRKETISLINSIKESSLNEAKESSSQAIEDDRFNTLISNFENKYSFLDENSDVYNREAVETVNVLLSGYQASGKSKTEALRLAVNKVAPMYNEKTKPSLGETRKRKSRRKAAKAANAQPQRTSSKRVKNIDTDTVEVGRLSERDFNKLTAKEKRILRGD